MSDLPRVLLVDDEAVLRRAIERATRGRMDLVLAADGAEALEILARDRSFVVLFFDIMMPGMSGIELYDAVQARWPGLEKRIVFITGGTFGPQGPLGTRPNTLLRKPLGLEALENEVTKRKGT